MSLSCVQCAAVASHRCSVCGTAYCGAACQNADWVEHKKGCEILAQILDLIGVKTKRKRDDDGGEEEVKKQKSVFEYNLVAFMLQLIKVQPDLAANFLRKRLSDVQSFVSLVNASSEVKDFANRKGVIAQRFPWLKDHVDDYLIVAPFKMDFGGDNIEHDMYDVVYSENVGWEKAALLIARRILAKKYDKVEITWFQNDIQWECSEMPESVFGDELDRLEEIDFFFPKPPVLNVYAHFDPPAVFLEYVDINRSTSLDAVKIHRSGYQPEKLWVNPFVITSLKSKGFGRAAVKYTLDYSSVDDFDVEERFARDFGEVRFYGIDDNVMAIVMADVKRILDNYLNISAQETSLNITIKFLK